MGRSLVRELLAKASGVERSVDQERAWFDDVLANVQSIVQARRGSLLATPEFGADDIGAIFQGSEAAVERFRARLEESIRLHEPRLTAIELRHKPSDDLVLRFGLRARRGADARAGGRPPA